MTHERSLSELDSMREASLDSALARAFPAPHLPPDFRARVLAAVARDHTTDRQARRFELERAHSASISKLNARFLRTGRDALLAGLAIVVTIGFSVKPLTFWLRPFMESSAPIAAGLCALGAGIACGAVILQELLGPAAKAHRGTPPRLFSASQADGL